MKKIRVFLSEKFQFLVVKFSIYLNRHVFVMLYISNGWSGYLLFVFTPKTSFLMSRLNHGLKQFCFCFVCLFNIPAYIVMVSACCRERIAHCYIAASLKHFFFFFFVVFAFVLFACCIRVLRHFQLSFGHIETVSGCGRELNAYF